MNTTKILRDALKDILNPALAMQRDLPDGYSLNGHAVVAACDNPQTYKDIAAKALAAAEGMEAALVGAVPDLTVKLRAAVQTLRRTPKPIEEVAPLLQQAADQIDQLNAALAERGTVGEPVDLQGDIMNLPMPVSESMFGHSLDYKRGHRDARHAAAELVAACATHPAPAGDVGLPVQASIGDGDMFGLLICNLLDAHEQIGTRNEKPDAYGVAYKRLIAYIDAQRAHAAPQVAVPKGCATDGRGTTYHNVDETYHQAEECGALHMWLDDQKVPRGDDVGTVYSPVGRVMRLLEGLTLAQQKELCKALEDLSFECFGVFGTCAPSVPTYNRTFAVLESMRAILATKEPQA